MKTGAIAILLLFSGLAGQSLAAPGLGSGRPPIASGRARLPAARWDRKVGTMLQGFHWNSAQDGDGVGKRGSWYDVVDRKAPEIGKHFNVIWMPPASKAAVEDRHGPAAQGYLPYSLMDLNSDYGSAQKLKDTLDNLRRSGVLPIADVVLNHISPSSLVKNTGARYSYDPKRDQFVNLEARDIVRESGGAGAADTGKQFTLVADVDHLSHHARKTYVQLLGTLGKAGFEGVRYDYAKGFSPRTLRLYNGVARPKFSVAELWEDFHGAEAHRAQLLDYIKQTGYRTAAFDFTTKAVLQDAVAKRDYSQLRDSKGHAAGLIGAAPGYAVTFVDNHDTGSSPGGQGGQKHWEFPSSEVMQGYAYILTHPGIPSVYWPHYFDWPSPMKSNPMKEEIDRLLGVRKELGIHATSPMRILVADNSRYAALVQGARGTLAMKIGPGDWQPPRPERWHRVAEGRNYAVWAKNPKSSAPPQ